MGWEAGKKQDLSLRQQLVMEFISTLIIAPHAQPPHTILNPTAQHPSPRLHYTAPWKGGVQCRSEQVGGERGCFSQGLLVTPADMFVKQWAQKSLRNAALLSISNGEFFSDFFFFFYFLESVRLLSTGLFSII